MEANGEEVKISQCNPESRSDGWSIENQDVVAWRIEGGMLKSGSKCLINGQSYFAKMSDCADTLSTSYVTVIPFRNGPYGAKSYRMSDNKLPSSVFPSR